MGLSLGQEAAAKFPPEAASSPLSCGQPGRRMISHLQGQDTFYRTYRRVHGDTSQRPGKSYPVEVMLSWTVDAAPRMMEKGQET